MMEKLFRHYRGPLTFVILLIFLGGMQSYRNMKTSLFPNITFPKIKIIADNGDQPVEKMMVTVTKPLENAIKQVEGLKLIQSLTSTGSCEISAFMSWSSDIDLDKQRLESRINQVRSTLPPDVSITIEKMNPSILPVVGYSLQSRKLDNIELRQLAENIIRPYLSRIDGVSAVDVIGGSVKEYRIIPDPAKMTRLNIQPGDFEAAFQKTGFIQSAGHIDDYRRLYLTVTDAAVYHRGDLEQLVLAATPERTIRVADVAKVEIAARKEYIRIRADGRNVPLIAVLKHPDANLIDVMKGISQSVNELNSGVLPADVKLKPYYNQSEFVKESIRSIIDVLWIGLLLAIIVTILFLRSLRASLVILIVIPLTLALTFIWMTFIGFDFNIMTIGAIAAAIGLIIDDAVIVVEQIHRTHEEHPDRKPVELVTKGVKFLLPAMVGSSLSTIVILIPFQWMSGVAGAYFKILTQTMAITLISSFFMVWIALPVIYLLLPEGKISAAHENAAQYGWIGFLLRRAWISGILVILMAVSVYILAPRLQTGFLPEMDEGSIVLDYNSPPGTSLEETDRMLTEVDKIIESVPEVSGYSRRTGTQMGFFITEPNSGDYLIELSRKRSRSTEEVADDIRSRIEEQVRALTADFGQVITDMLGDLMSSVQPIEIKIFGDDHTQLEALSRQVADSVATVAGTADVFDGIVEAGPSFRLHPRSAVLEQYGMSAEELHMQVEIALDGRVIGSIPEKEQLTDIRVLREYPVSPSLETLRNLSIITPNGTPLPLHIFADIEIQKGAAEIDRENLQTMGVVTARLNQRDLGSVMKDIRSRLAGVQLPPSYQIVYGGSYAEQQKSFGELLRILFTGGLMVFAVVLFMFRNVRLAASVLFISVLGLSGSIIALFITHTPLNVGSYTGIIMIIGIIGENSIFTIQQFMTALADRPAEEAIRFSIATRLRPKLMTVISAVLALSPLAAGIGTGAQMHQPLAIAVIGGLLAALPLLLIILPQFLKFIYRD